VNAVFIILFCDMISKRKTNAPPAPQISAQQLEEQLRKIGNHLKACRKNRTTQERFSYETKISKAAILKCEQGHDMLLSTLLRFINGLEIPIEEFFATME